MLKRLTPAVLLLGFAAACSPSEDAAPAAEESAPTEVAAAGTGTALACDPTDMPLEGRASPYDSVTVNLGGEQAKICYGRPSVNGRTIFGSTIVPWDTIWRTGANEPTIIHLPVAATIAGVRVEPGSYSIYTVPGQQEWDVIVNRSITQWGIETEYTPEVRAQEVGRGTVPAEQTQAPVETFTITSEETPPNRATLVMEWEGRRVRIPIERA